jgi:AraC-like DNA-binding protein
MNIAQTPFGLPHFDPQHILAREAGVSARTVTRLFPAQTRLTFKQWRQRARIVAGIEMLRSGERSIKQVSSKLGFSSVAAFAHAFGQVVGVSPTAYRKQNKTINDSPDPERPRA